MKKTISRHIGRFVVRTIAILVCFQTPSFSSERTSYEEQARRSTPFAGFSYQGTDTRGVWEDSSQASGITGRGWLQINCRECGQGGWRVGEWGSHHDERRSMAIHQRQCPSYLARVSEAAASLASADPKNQLTRITQQHSQTLAAVEALRRAKEEDARRLAEQARKIEEQNRLIAQVLSNQSTLEAALALQTEELRAANARINAIVGRPRSAAKDARKGEPQ